MNTIGNAQYTVVAGVDESDMAHTVLEHTLDLVNRHDNATLHVLGVVPHRTRLLHRNDATTGRLDETNERVSALVREKLEDFEQGAAAGTLSVHVHARDGIPAEELVSLAAECGADLIVIGRHGSNRRHRFLVGSVPERVLKTASCSVIIVQPTDYGEQDTMSETPCAECTTTRANSGGERWFCDEHSEGRAFRSTNLLTMAGTGSGRLT